MGLFDKLRGVVDTAKNTINSVMDANDPLADLTVKKYFEIVCGMRHTFLSSGEELVTGNVKAKRYVEYFLGGACDEEKLEKTLELYNISRTDYPKGKTEEVLSKFRKSLMNAKEYQLDRFKACELFCQEEIAAAAVEYDKILNVIKDNINYMHFSQGLKKMQCDEAVKSIVIANSFYDGNPITQKLVLMYLIDSYCGRINSSKFNSLYDYHDDVALLVLKALHFEKYGGDKENYISITDEDYRKFVLSVNYYKNEIDDNPFDKEEYIVRFAEGIKKREVFYIVYTSFGRECFHISCIDDYFCDAVCNLAWKVIATKRKWLNQNGDDVSESNRESDVFNILCTYLRDPDED